VSGPDVYLGGGFNHVGEADRAGVAAIDLSTGEATPWNAALDGGARRVEALVVRGDTLYIAGDFTGGGGSAPRRAGRLVHRERRGDGMAARAARAGAAPGPAVGPAGIYLLGRETAAGGAVPVAATDPATGAAGAWTPSVAGTAFIVPAERGIRAAAALGDTLVLGGSFATSGRSPGPSSGRCRPPPAP
jgi:trimeric autotransporter adhesin